MKRKTFIIKGHEVTTYLKAKNKGWKVSWAGEGFICLYKDYLKGG